MILEGGKNCSLPLWKSARENFTNDMHVQVEDLQSCGFNVEISDVELIGHVTKEQWFWKIRNRMFSTFALMSDEEIEAGITEVDDTLLHNVKNEEEITIRHNMYGIIATMY